jgi:hypothetical protein
MLGTFYELPAIWNAPLAPLGSPSSHTRSGFSPASGAAAEPAGITSEGPSTNGNQAMNGNRSGNGQHALQQAQASQLQQAQQEGDDLSQFPVVIMSHGLAGTRNTYSTICCELASHVSVGVCAIGSHVSVCGVIGSHVSVCVCHRIENARASKCVL